MFNSNKPESKTRVVTKDATSPKPPRPSRPQAQPMIRKDIKREVATQNSDKSRT
jgi:hypothetical protein